jgi:hypothetical protein
VDAANIGAWSAAIGVLIAVATFGYGIRQGTRSRAQGDITARDKVRSDAEETGAARTRAELQPQIDLLLSNLGDCRRDRDLEHARAQEYERRYLDLRDKGK